MTTSPKPENKKTMESNQAPDKRVDKIANPNNLFSDPDYLKLLEHFQHAEFTICQELLHKLMDRFPEHPDLLRFKEDLQMKMSIYAMTVSITEEEKLQNKKTMLKMSGFAVIGTLIVMIVFFISYFLLNFNVTDEILEGETEQLSVLSYQAEQLLKAGRPQPAVEIIKKMIIINQDFEDIPDLILRSDKLLELKADYQTALNLLAENKNNEAMDIFNKIETDEPGLWDVSQQIAIIETYYKVASYKEEGTAAYEAEDWDKVINAYENALKLDPNEDDPLLKEQLLRGYLNKIISMLDNESITMEDITQAEEYYRRAIAMIPQSKTFANERENLQKANSNLLELKFTEIAKASLEDIEQTITSIDRAVSFLKTTAGIKPDNKALQADLLLAEYYQTGFKNFIEMNWEAAIANFDKIYTIDPNYANGNVSVLLFEAYNALGKQYYSAGFYLDAINKLEKAEILAWYDTDNLMKLFQIQIFLGDANEKLEDYANAVSYYQYALNAIQVDSKLGDFPDIAAKLDEARNNATFGSIKNAVVAYKAVLKEIDVVFSISEIEVGDGICLALFAKENLTTVDAILKANELPTSMVITFGRKLNVPIID